MPLTILVAAAATADGLDATAVAEHVRCGARRAASEAAVLRCLPDDAVIRRGDLVLVAGASSLNTAMTERAAELGVPAVVLAGSPRTAAPSRHPVGLVMFEPDGHPDAIDADLEALRLRQGAFHAVAAALHDHPRLRWSYASTMPAPTVSLLASSTRMNAPVARLTA